MLSLTRLFGPSRPSRPTRPFRTSLRLETLDGRFAPSGLGDDPGDPPPTDPAQISPPPPPAQGQTAPVIDSFVATVEGIGFELVSGHVTAANPAGLTVTFGGVPALDGKSCVTDSNGNFQLLVQVKTDGTDQGTIWAQTSDANGQSNQALAYMDP